MEVNEPSVALIGDSIRMHYQPSVAAELAGVVDVWGPDVNCESSRHLRDNLDIWVLDRLDRPSIVHVNAGAHDVRRNRETDWDVQVPVDECRTNMADVVDQLLAHQFVSHVVVAITVPVDEVRHNSGRYSTRLNSNIVAYNQMLREIASDRSLPVSDLWAALSDCSFDPLSVDGVHLTPDGNIFAGRHVADFLGTVLPAGTR